jgi:hypothetical protein
MSLESTFEAYRIWLSDNPHWVAVERVGYLSSLTLLSSETSFVVNDSSLKDA